MNRNAGYLLIAASAVGFGLMPTFASWARAGMSMEVMLALRFTLAAIVLAGVTVFWKLPLPRGRVLAGLAAVGAVGIVAQSLCYFSALRHLPSGTAALLFYVYPVSLTALAWIFFRERVSPRHFGAIVVAALGLLMLLAPLSTGGTLGKAAVGVGLALASGLLYAAVVMAAWRVIAQVGAIQAALVICAAAAVVMLIVAGARGPAFPMRPAAWGGAAALALVSTVGGLTCFLAGLRLAGPVRASMVSALEPVVAVAAGALILGERLTGWTVAGGVLVIAAAVFIAMERQPRSAAGPGRGPARR